MLNTFIWQAKGCGSSSAGDTNLCGVSPEMASGIKCCQIKCADLAGDAWWQTESCFKCRCVFVHIVVWDYCSSKKRKFLSLNILKIFVEHMLTQICSKEVRLARKTLVAFVSPHLSSVTWKGSFSQCLHFENERMDIYVKQKQNRKWFKCVSRGLGWWNAANIHLESKNLKRNPSKCNL